MKKIMFSERYGLEHAKPDDIAYAIKQHLQTKAQEESERII